VVFDGNDVTASELVYFYYFLQFFLPRSGRNFFPLSRQYAGILLSQRSKCHKHNKKCEENSHGIRIRDHPCRGA